MSEKFSASVQYNDWKGTTAADKADGDYNIESYLTERMLINSDERVLGLTVWIGENRQLLVEGAYIEALVFPYDPAGGTIPDQLSTIRGPIPVRKVRIEMDLLQFFARFKRFSMVLTNPSLKLDDREYNEVVSRNL